MLLASDALSKFDGSIGPATAPAQQQPPPPQQPVAEAHPPPTTRPAPPETAPPVVEPAAAAVVPVAEPRAVKTPPEGGSTEKKEEVRQEEPQAAAAATTNLNSAKAEAKLVKALDYLVAINDNSDNPAQKWFINESILAVPDIFGLDQHATFNRAVTLDDGWTHSAIRRERQRKWHSDDPTLRPHHTSSFNRGQ